MNDYLKQIVVNTYEDIEYSILDTSGAEELNRWCEEPCCS